MEELSYAIVTPYSMRKSRTGGIVARLISRTGLDVVAGRMFAPSPELVSRYAETIVTETQPRHRATQELNAAFDAGMQPATLPPCPIVAAAQLL